MTRKNCGWTRLLASCLGIAAACGDASSTELGPAGVRCDVALNLVDGPFITGASLTPLMVALRVDESSGQREACVLDLEVATIPAGLARLEVERLVFDDTESQTVAISVDRTEPGPVEVSVVVTKADSEDGAEERIDFRVEVESGSYELRPAPAEVQVLPVLCDSFMQSGLLTNTGRVPLVVTASLTLAPAWTRRFVTSRPAVLQVPPGEASMTGLWIDLPEILGPTSFEVSLLVSTPEAPAAARQDESRTVEVEFRILRTWKPNVDADAWTIVPSIPNGPASYARLIAGYGDLVVDAGRLEVRRNGELLPRSDTQRWQPGEWRLFRDPEQSTVGIEYLLPSEIGGSFERARAHLEGITIRAPAAGCPD